VTQKFDDLRQALKKYLDAQGTFVWESLTGGRKFYVDKDSTTGAARVEHHKDLCAAKLTLDKVVRFDESLSTAGVRQGTLFYTYHVTVMPWALSADAQRVFPMIDRIIKGEGTEATRAANAARNRRVDRTERFVVTRSFRFCSAFMRDAVFRRSELKDQPSQPTPHWSELEEPATQGFEWEGIQPTRTGVLPPPDGRFSARGFEPGHAGAVKLPTRTHRLRRNQIV
jgi:hypothetical protein